MNCHLMHDHATTLLYVWYHIERFAINYTPLEVFFAVLIHPVGVCDGVQFVGAIPLWQRSFVGQKLTRSIMAVLV